MFIPLFTGFYIHPRWLAGFLTSTVWSLATNSASRKALPDWKSLLKPEWRAALRADEKAAWRRVPKSATWRNSMNLGSLEGWGVFCSTVLSDSGLLNENQNAEETENTENVLEKLQGSSYFWHQNCSCLRPVLLDMRDMFLTFLDNFWVWSIFIDICVVRSLVHKNTWKLSASCFKLWAGRSWNVCGEWQRTWRICSRMSMTKIGKIWRFIPIFFKPTCLCLVMGK